MAEADVTGATPTVTFSHTTAGTNTLLVVGVDMNITGNTGATVTGVTYNGVALTRAGFHNDVGLTRRVEMWYLTAPAAGAHNVIVTLSLPGGTGTVGIVAGATTFTGVDQAVPVRSFISNDGPAVACSTGVFCSQLDVASGLGEMVIDTLAHCGQCNGHGHEFSGSAMGPHLGGCQCQSGRLWAWLDPYGRSQCPDL